MSKTLIVSDIHLKAIPEDRPRHAEFIAFLKRFDPAEYTRLICLGDLFDFWYEYKTVIFSDYFEVLRVFADLRDAGVELHLICGNHDFWAGRFLRDDLGFHVHPNDVDLPFGDKRARIIHGDGINPDDTRYRLYKSFARNPFVVGAFRMIHPDWAMGIACAVSHGSRTMFKTPDPLNGPEARSLRAYAEAVLAAGEADYVLCGHAHAMEMREFSTPTGTGLYLNTGDWLERRCHTVWDGERFTQVDEAEPR
ncbi:MAG: hypothetical protein GC168_14030 [Candidatus Hydrogenedens sp.]|nr:hypothetical protein [Candidatus Hydrogenedens sp.]